MKNTKNTKELHDKLGMKIEFDKNIRTKNIFENSPSNKIINKRKQIINQNSNEIKNKPITTETIFNSKNENNYQPLNYKSINSNPFRNSVNGPQKNTNKKNSGVLIKKKFVNNILNLTTSYSNTEKKCYIRKDNSNNIKTSNFNYKEPSSNIKKCIIENRIKKENKQKEGKQNQKSKEKSIIKNNKERKNNLESINKKIIKKNGKDSYIINGKKNKLIKIRGNDIKYIKIENKEKAVSLNKIKHIKENGKNNNSQKISELQKEKKEKKLINIDKNEQKDKYNYNRELKLNEINECNEFKSIDKNSTIENNNKNEENNNKENELNKNIINNSGLIIKKEEEYSNEDKIYKKNEDGNEQIMENNKINHNNKNSSINKNSSNLKINGNNSVNNIINNGKNKIDLNELNQNINGNIQENFSQNNEIINNGLESINRNLISVDKTDNIMGYKKNDNNIQNKQEKLIKEIINDEKDLKTEIEFNPVPSIINNIQDLIIQSKSKIEKDLKKVVIKEKENSIEYQLNIPREIKGYHNSKGKIFDLKNNKRNNSKRNKKQIQQNLNEGSNTENDFKVNENLRIQKSFKNKNKKNNLIQIKSNNQIKINKSYAISYKNKINKDNSFEYVENNDLSKRVLKKSMSKKKSKFIKYDDIDLNTLFSKSSKKGEKKAKIQNFKNIELEKENGGNISNSGENEDKNSEDFALQNETNFEDKLRLKKIMLSKKPDEDYIKIKNSNDYINSEESENERHHELININKELVQEITELRREVEYSKKQIRKKDEKLLKYLNKYDKIARQNAYNMEEIENLEEELITKRNEMNIKTKKIKELTDKNNNLEQKMSQLKIFYKNKNSIHENSKRNNNHFDKIIEEENITESKDIEKSINFEELSVEELHNKRNTLIKERNKLNFLYEKLPIKLVNREQLKEKQELENRLNKINNYLMKIRLQLKNYDQ